MRTVRLKASKSYDIVIGQGLLDRAGEYIKKAAGGRVAAVVTDDIVGPLYGRRLEASLEGQGYGVVKYTIEQGEASKNACNFISLLNFFAQSRMSRTDVVVALGGGVVGDLAGFAAASYMRGTKFVQLPTTLLAAVDSSVGGKTAIDLEAGKNLAGAFYQPDLVLCDHVLLRTLSAGALRDGLAEVIKYGVIADSELFGRLKSPVFDQIEQIIGRCVEIKRDVVCEDETEQGARKLFNFGHTVGHAIEHLSGFGLSHGRAVAAGMAVMARAANRKGICPDSSRDEILEMIAFHGLETTTGYTPNEIWKACLNDKKRSGGSISLVVPERVGHCRLMEVSLEELLDFIILGVEGE
jgi:3-dehydroquinate synthase